MFFYASECINLAIYTPISEQSGCVPLPKKIREWAPNNLDSNKSLVIAWE